MDEFEQLGLLAEIAAAFLGFIALFLALSRDNGRFAESDRHFIQALVVTASLTIVLALSPRAISLFATDALTWFSATIVAIILGSLAMFVQARQQFRMSHDEALQIHWVWHLVAWALGIFAAVLFVLALLNSASASAYFVGGVSVQVALSLWVFIGVVFRRFF